MTALFSTSHASKLSSHNTVEFKAGKLQLSGTTVTADKRKGKFKLQFNADNLLQLTWTDRSTNLVEDDFVIMPDEVEFVKVAQCTTGRVFLLKWKDHGRQLFFWLQEPDSTKDESLLKRVSDLVTNPKPSQPSLGRDRSGLPSNFLEDLTRLHSAGSSSGRTPHDLYELFRAMSSSGMSVFLPQGEGTAAAFASAVSGLTNASSEGAAENGSDSPALSISDLAAANTASTSSSMGGFQPPSEGLSVESYRSALKEAIRMARVENDQSIGTQRLHRDTSSEQPHGQGIRADFSRALSWQSLSWFFCEHPEELEPLRQLLPPGRPKTNNEVIDSLQCPQLGQAKREIAYVIQSGHFGPIAQQFGLSNERTDIALANGDLIGFCAELDAMLSNKQEGDRIEQEEEEDEEGEEGDKKDSEDDTVMDDLD